MALRDLFRPIEMNPQAARPRVAFNALEPVSAPFLNTQTFQTYRQSLALAVAAVYRARQMNADTLAAQPLRPTPDTLATPPNRDQTVQEFVAETVLSMQDCGDAYWQTFRNGDLRVLPYAEVIVTWNADRTNRLYSYRNRRFRTFGMKPQLIVLSMNRGRGDERGFGPMQSERVAGLIAEQKWSQEYFDNNANPTGVLTVIGDLDKEEAAKLRQQWEILREVRGPAVASGGATWAPSSFSATDSDWVDTHLAGIGDAATLFGVPSTLLNYNQPGSSLTYESIGDVYQAYWRGTIHPTYASRIEKAWAAHHKLPQVRFDPEALFLASMNTRARSAAALVNVGYVPSDVADAVGLPPIKHTGKIPVTVQKEESA